jgi:hypothetical protein
MDDSRDVCVAGLGACQACKQQHGSKDKVKDTDGHQDAPILAYVLSGEDLEPIFTMDWSHLWPGMVSWCVHRGVAEITHLIIASDGNGHVFQSRLWVRFLVMRPMSTRT